jgi:hypothetical protein
MRDRRGSRIVCSGIQYLRRAGVCSAKCSVVFLCNIILDAQFMLRIMASNSILVLLQEDKRLEFCIRPSHRAVSLKECFVSSAGLTGELQ